MAILYSLGITFSNYPELSFYWVRMPRPTCLMNSQRLEYIVLYDISPATRAFYIRELERRRGWDIKHDHIFISFLVADHFEYTRVTDICTVKSQI